MRPIKIDTRPVELMTVAVLSTCHLSYDEAQAHGPCWPTHCLESEYGFIAYVGKEPGNPDLSDWPGLRAARDWAAQQGIEWVRFDRDGLEQPGLVKYDW